MQKTLEMKKEKHKMNIMYIFNDEVFGGAGQSLIDTLIKIKEEVNAIVVIREGAEEVKIKFDEMGIRCYQISFSIDYAKIGSISIENKAADITKSYEAALKLLPIVKEEEIDLIHINSSVSYFAAITALMAGIPYIWHIRELMDEHYGCEFINKDLKKNLYVYADRMIAISDYVREEYLAKYNIQMMKIYNGLNVEKYKVPLNKNRKSPNIFLAAGMISPSKGQWDAIRATENLIQRGYKDIKLNIVGDTDTGYTWALKKYIKMQGLDQNISILPFQDDLYALREKATYSLTCSQSEALGRATIEAMLAGNFMIGAKSGGTVEIIGEKEERGYFYELHNVEALAEAMVRAMQCPKKTKEQMVAAAQVYAEETFDSRRYCKKLLDIYNEVIASYRPKNAECLLEEIKGSYAHIENERSRKDKPSTQYRKSEAALAISIKWLKIKQAGHSLDEYFAQNNIRSIAIYGMAALGCRLYDELEDGDTEIKYLLDRNPGGMDSIFDFASLDGEQLEVDAIVVTVAGEERQIVKEIQERGCQKVLGLREILDDLWNGFSMSQEI